MQASKLFQWQNNLVDIYKIAQEILGKSQVTPRRDNYETGPTPEARRVIALMEIYGLTSPTAFAKAVGVNSSRLHNVITGGMPSGKHLAIKIRHRFPVGLEWLFFGTRGDVHSLELEQKLHDYERRHGVELFTR